MGYPQGPPPKQGMSTLAKVMIGLGLLMLCFFGACFAMCAAGVKGAADQQAKEKKAYDDQTATKVTAEEMIATYAKNQIAGDEKYKDKKLEITGKVKEIHSNVTDDPVIVLGGDGFTSVMAHNLPKEDAAKLNKGDSVTLVCKGGGVIVGSPVLKNCEKK
jgi:hypothetical protein